MNGARSSIRSVSVVLVTKNRPEELERALQSLLKQDLPPCQVIVVDSSPNPVKTSKLLTQIESTSDILAIHLQRDCSLPEGRNIGIDAAIGDYVMFLDDDVVLESNYTGEVMKAFESNQRIGGVEGDITNRNVTKGCLPRLLWILSFITYNSCPFPKSCFRRSGACLYLYHSGEDVDVGFVSGSNMTFRTEVLRTHRFDENLRGWCMEDHDISLRVSKHWTLRRVCRAMLTHHESPRSRINRPTMVSSAISNSGYLHRKNFPQSTKNRIAFKISILGKLMFQMLLTLGNGDTASLKAIVPSCYYEIARRRRS